MEKESGLLGCLNQIKLSCRKVFIRHLRIFVSIGTANEREKIRRSRSPRRTGEFRDDRPLFSNGKAFTLIELLVVVLIIGILAAVALPQYQKAVEKSKATQAITMLKSVYQSAAAYELANGTWPTAFDELSIEIPWSGNVSGVGTAVTDVRSNAEWSLELYGGGPLYAGIIITRLSGKYAGSQFQIWKRHESNQVPSDTLLCGEQKTGTYKLAEGVSFCTKLFQGTTKLADGTGGRVYTFLQ